MDRKVKVRSGGKLMRINLNNGKVCHEVAERGARTGTQGLADAAERGRIPYKLADAVRRAAERGI